MEELVKANQAAREALSNWKSEIEDNIYTNDVDFIHSIKYYFLNEFVRINSELENFGHEVAKKIEPLVSENNLPANLPKLEAYNSLGERIDHVVHHPSYIEIGDLIYQTKLLEKMSKPGGLLECLSILFLSSQAGEAGHNCPIACSAGIIRVLQKISDFPKKAFYLEKLTLPSFQTNFTGAQFLTEIQGGSDVGLNTVYAKKNGDISWQIHGEKWFCSNAGADLIFMTARYDDSSVGTQGLGLFLVPREWNNQKNHYTIHRLKDKIGTRSMATGEIYFHGANAFLVGTLQEGFHLVMNNVLHLSRLFNSICVLGMGRRAYTIARAYAKNRVAFSHPIIDYPLVQEALARIKAENTAMLAAAFSIIRMQDKFDTAKSTDKNQQLLLRLLVNIMKYVSARFSVEHIHHSLDVLAGNGTIESFSSLPRLLRDCIVCENWEGTHNVLRMQVLKDILKYHVDDIYLAFIKQQLDALQVEDEYKQALLDEFNQLTKYLADFRQLNQALQSLHIQFVVDRMAILFCALTLLIEAMDQQNTMKSSSKLDCYHYFSLLHLQKEKLSYDQNYLTLVARIIA